MHVAHNRRALFGKGSLAPSVAGKVAVKFFAAVDTVDAYVDNRRARLDHFRGNEAGSANGGHQNIGLACDRAQVASLGVAYGDRCILVEQQHGGRLAHKVAAAHHHGVPAGDGDSAALQYLNHSRGRAGRERRTSGLQAPRIDGMQSVHILARSNGVQHSLGIDMRGKGQLDENAVDLVAGVERGNQLQHLLSGDGVGRRDEVAEDAQIGAGLHFVADVDLRCRHMAHQHRRKARPDALGNQRTDLIHNFPFDLCGNRRPIQNFWHPALQRFIVSLHASPRSQPTLRVKRVNRMASIRRRRSVIWLTYTLRRSPIASKWREVRSIPQDRLAEAWLGRNGDRAR